MYDFKQLSPADFEDLTRDLLQQEWGVRLEAFKSGRDRGIDLRYAAIQKQSIIIQCKHWVGSTVTKLNHELRTSEAPKVEALKPDRYVLVTSLPLNPAGKEKIKATFHPFVLSTDDIMGANDLNNLLGRHPGIEKKHFKLWLSSTEILARVLHNAEHVQTDFEIHRVRRAIPLYVQTMNYPRAMEVLSEHRVVIISGVPGIGKTTLADMLLFTHLEAGYEPVIIKSEIIEGKRLFNNEKRQIFYFDDFLGQTFLEHRIDFLGKREDSVILDFIEIVSSSKHSKLVLTTREHVLQTAFQISEPFQRQRGGLTDRRCVLELDNYTLLDRARILYNHIYFSDLPYRHKEQLLKDSFYMRILRHKNFNPRLVEWLSRYTNLRTVPARAYQSEVLRVLENPEQLWQVAFERQISDSSRSVLLALYSLGGSARLDLLEEAWRALHPYRAKKYNWQTAPRDWRRSLQELEGGFLAFEMGDASFVNPSVKDFFDSIVVADVEHIDDILSSACLFEQVVHIWSLSGSEKGDALRGRFNQSPQHLVQAVKENLRKPHQKTIDTGRGARETVGRDVWPETKLYTIISIADQTRSESAFEEAANYLQDVIRFWENQVMNCRMAVTILHTLDRAKWPILSKSDLHSQLKAAMLRELAESSDSSDIHAIAQYAGASNSRWADTDQQILVGCFEHYLSAEFEFELANCDNVSECEELSTRLDYSANWCDVDIGAYEAEIAERISEMGDAEDEDNSDARNWEQSGRRVSEPSQEAEIARLFDGLRGERLR